MATTYTCTKEIPCFNRPKSTMMEVKAIPNLFASIPRQHKKHKPISRGTYEFSRLSRVRRLDLNDPSIRLIPRAGVVFYTFINNELHVCFGRDKKSGEITDFGGGRKDFESPIQCAVREGNEESRYAFSKIHASQVQGFFCLYSSIMLIIFIPVASPNEMDIRHITTQNFMNRQFLTNKETHDRRYNEISEIMWFNEEQLSNLFSQRPAFPMFAKVRRFIYSCHEFSQNINVMKDVLRSVVSASPEDLTYTYTWENPLGLRCGDQIAEHQRFVRAVHT